MIEPMQTPVTRAEFERRFHLLRERLRQGKMMFAKQEMTSGILRVRFLPNKRIDFLSVNESARINANMMNPFDSEDFKQMLESQMDQNSSDDNKPEHNNDEPIE